MSPIDDLLDRWEDMRECGQKITPEQLCMDHPELLPEVRRQINALEAVSLQFGSQGMEGQATASEADWSPASHFELLNRFEIIKLHASGGLGHVYLAHDKVLDRPVAIKFLKRAELTSEQLARFEWEAKITGKLEHPGIVPIHSMQESENSTPCYVMRFVNGLTLQQRVETIWKSDPAGRSATYFLSEQLRELLRSFAAVCNIVAYAHAQGVLHRDIKPGNIMLGPFGETLLLDWGIAKPFSADSNSSSHALPRSLQSVPTDPAHLKFVGGIYSPAFTATGQAIGTPAYASPEQLQGLEVASQPTTDVFSLGATLHFILSCKSPIEFFGWSSYLDQVAVTDSMLAANLSSTVPKALRAICSKALRTRPQDRYQSAMELAEDIQNFLLLEPVSVQPNPWHARMARWARKRPAMAGSFIASMIVVLIATLISSAFLRASNHRLMKTTVSLNQSLERTNFANRQTIESLRQMFDDVVIHYFGQRDILNDQDRSYLSKLVARYELFTSQQEDGIQNRTTRAEANYRIGRLYYHLQMADRDPLNYAQTATQLYSALCHRDKQYQLVGDYLESLRMLSEIQIEQAEDADGAIKTVELCLSEREQLSEKLEPNSVAQWLEVQASLHAILAACQVEKSEWKEAFKSAKQAATDYEMLVESQPDEHRFLHKLAAALSLLAELAEHPETECNVDTQLEYANRSVLLSERHLQLEPRLALSRVGRSWSYYSRSLTFLRMNRLEESQQDIDQAISSVEYLRERFDSKRFDRSIVNFRTSKIKLLRKSDKWPDIVDEIGHLRMLSLNQHTTSVCIEALEQYQKHFAEDHLQRTVLAEMYSRRARLRALEDNQESLIDRQEAIEILDRLVQEDPNEFRYQVLLVQAIHSAANDQRKLGTATESDRLWQRAKVELLKLRDIAPDEFEKLNQELNP